MVDTLRADHVSLYGYDRPTTPHLDKFAESALVFEDVFAPSSWTLPSVGSLLTSTYPSIHGIRAKEGGTPKVRSLREKVATLAEAFHDAGYRTVAVITNEWMIPKHGFGRGFDQYTVLHHKDARFANAVTERAGLVNNLGREAVERERIRPVFLYLHYMDVHGPYDKKLPDAGVLGPVPGTDRKLTKAELRALDFMRLPGIDTLAGYRDAYDRGIRYWDSEFGKWLAWLRETRRFQGTIIGVVSDHGEEFLDHGGWEHGETLYQEQLAVPWVLRVPGQKPGWVRGRVVSLIDVAPTLLAAAGLPIPDSMGGHDARQPVQATDKPLFSELEARDGRWGACEQLAVRRGHRKLIWKRKDKELSGVEREFYDLLEDPHEQSPRPEEWTDLTQDLQHWVIESTDQMEKLGPSSEHELSPDVVERLRALGY